MNIAETISSLSLLVVFVTVLFSYFVAKADELINFELSSISTNKDKLTKQNKKINAFIWFNWFFPIVLLNIATCWLLLPTAISIIKTHSFAILYFDIEPSIFIFITFYLIIFVILSIIKFVKLIGVRRKIVRIINKP